jgi:hypothetical protein
VLSWKRRKISRWSHDFLTACLGTVRPKPQIQSDCSTLIRRRGPVKMSLSGGMMCRLSRQLLEMHTCAVTVGAGLHGAGQVTALNIYRPPLIHLCKMTASNYQISSITRCILVTSCKVDVHRYLTAPDIRSATREIDLRVPSAPVFSFVSEQTTSHRFSP